MPRLGWDMQVGSVAEWLKRDGERVAAGEPICMIAGDKTTTELEAVDSGILRLSPRSPEPGVEVPVGTVLAYLVAPGEEIPHEPDTAPVDAGMRSDATRRIVASPRARRAAAALGWTGARWSAAVVADAFSSATWPRQYPSLQHLDRG